MRHGPYNALRSLPLVVSLLLGVAGGSFPQSIYTDTTTSTLLSELANQGLSSGIAAPTSTGAQGSLGQGTLGQGGSLGQAPNPTVGGDLSSSTTAAALAMTNPDYRVTPGDRYMLSYMTAQGPISAEFLVDAAYGLNLSNLGSIAVKGLSFSDLTAKVEALVLKSYPLSAPRMILTAPGVFRVYVTGEVNRSGWKDAWGLSQLSDLTILTTPWASTRRIVITAADGTERAYDLFQAERDGIREQNPYLRPGDSIRFTKARTMVKLEGEVRRPGTYELLEDERLEALVNRYGDGLTKQADATKLIYTDFAAADSSVGSKETIAFSDNSDMVLHDQDIVQVLNKNESRPFVFFEGAVIPAGSSLNQATTVSLGGAARISYQFSPGETVGDAVRAIRDRFDQVSDLQRAYVQRGSETFLVDLTQYLYNAHASNEYPIRIPLKPNDVIIVPMRQYFVSVAGAVMIPGRYPYVPDRTWNYYVNLAGGIDPTRSTGKRVNLTDLNDKKLPLDGYIPPEGKLLVATDSFLYYFNKYAPVVTSILAVISTSATVYAVATN